MDNDIQKDNENEKVPCPLEYSNKYGLIKIDESVISSIVRKAALSVQGVDCLSLHPIIENISYYIGYQKLTEKAVSIKFIGDSLFIELKVKLDHEINIPDTAKNIQETVSAEIKKATGLNVSKIDVHIQGINSDTDKS